MTPRVTVLITVFDGAATLGEAVDSVRAQTEEDWELLVVDDCSRDGSIALLESYRDPRIRIVRNERNLGQVASLNHGLGEARAELVARLDQDDVCLPDRLRRQADTLDAQAEPAIVGAWMDMVDEAGQKVGELRGRIDDRPDFLFALLTDFLPLFHPGLMFRRRAALDAGGYDESVRLAEDRDLWRRIALAGHSAVVVPEVLGLYRVHGGQQSQQRAVEQGQNNGASLDRFVQELAPGTRARLLRLLLTWDPDFWSECRTRRDARNVANDLARLLSACAARYGLSPEEVAKLHRLVRGRVAAAARASWRQGWRAAWHVAPPLYAFGKARTPAER